MNWLAYIGIGWLLNGWLVLGLLFIADMSGNQKYSEWALVMLWWPVLLAVWVRERWLR